MTSGGLDFGADARQELPGGPFVEGWAPIEQRAGRGNEHLLAGTIATEQQRQSGKVTLAVPVVAGGRGDGDLDGPGRAVTAM